MVAARDQDQAYEERAHFTPPPQPSTPEVAPWVDMMRLVRRLDKMIELLERLLAAQGVVPGPGIPPGIIWPQANAFRSRTITITSADIAQPLIPSSEPDVVIPNGFQLTVIAAPANSGVVRLGYTKEEAESSTMCFKGLTAGLAHSLKVDRVKAVWATSDTAADEVSWSVEQHR